MEQSDVYLGPRHGEKWVVGFLIVLLALVDAWVLLAVVLLRLF